MSPGPSPGQQPRSRSRRSHYGLEALTTADSFVPRTVGAVPHIRAGAWSRQPLEQVIAHADRVGNCGQGGVHRPNADKETRVHDIQIIELMRLAVRVQHGGLRICAEPARPGLMGTTCDWDVGLHIDVAWDEV